MEEKMENKNVLIGDYLGTIEEFVPGDGTYAEE
jgi:exosome complex RNA-binding protein Csl4